MFKLSKIGLASGLLAISVLFGCSGGVGHGGQVAVVNNDVITKQEFQQNYDRLLKMMRLNPADVKGEQSASLTDMFKKMTVQNLILSHLIQQEADKRHIAVTDKDVQAVYDTHVTQAGGEKAMKEQLDKMGITVADFKDQIKDQLTKDKVVQAVAGDKAAVNESEAKLFYNAHAQEFDQPEQVRARHILVSADPAQIKQDILVLKKDANPEDLQKQIESTMADKRKKAEQLYAAVKANPNQFEDIARNSSDDKGSAKLGGDLGYFSRELMVPAFSQAAFSTKPGQIHEGLVESPFGYHIIEVIDRKAPEKHTFEDVKGQIISYLQNQRKTQVMENWFENEKKSAKIEIEPAYNFDKAAQIPSRPQAAAIPATSQPVKE